MYESIKTALVQALLEVISSLGFDTYLVDVEDKPAFVEKTIRVIEPPRDWGLTSTVSVEIASAKHADELAELEKSLGRKKARKKFNEIVRPTAAQISAQIASSFTKEFPWLKRVAAEGIYINFYFRIATVSETILRLILQEARKPFLAYGSPDEKPRVMIEFSQPNTHKEFHIGHLRNVLIGNAIANLYEFCGYPVVRANYYGDHGIHVAKTLWALKRLYNSILPSDEDAVVFLGRAYAQAEQTLADLEGTEQASSIHKEQLEILANISDPSTEDYNLWLVTRNLFLDYFDSIYKELGVRFDVAFFESEMEKKGREVVRELIQKGVAKKEEKGDYAGTVFVDFADFSASELGKMVLMRSDGTSLYQTKELALAKEKFTRKFKGSDGKEGKIDVSLYVVGSEQSLYFQQIFKILEAWGFPQAKNCKHISYELVQLAHKKMSSREGSVISYRDFMAEALSRARQLTDERGITKDKDEVARLVALGAIKYAFLKVSTDKTIVFDWEKALTFDGNAGPYIQYAHARARKLIIDFENPLLGSAGTEEDDAKTASVNLIPDTYTPQKEEVELLRVLADMPSELNTALLQHAPNVICNYAYRLTRAFTNFYDNCPVLSADEPVRTFRRCLVYCFDRVLSLLAKDILGIELPEEM